MINSNTTKLLRSDPPPPAASPSHLHTLLEAVQGWWCDRMVKLKDTKALIC